jgi:hypothetical protein
LHATATSQIDILADDGFEKLPPADRTLKDIGAAAFQLPQRQFVMIAGLTILSTQRPRQLLHPALEEILELNGSQAAADFGQAFGFLTGQKAVV